MTDEPMVRVATGLKPWKMAEDRLLRSIVAEYGLRRVNWKRVAMGFHHRNAESCQRRYRRLMTPDVKRYPKMGRPPLTEAELRPGFRERD